MNLKHKNVSFLNFENNNLADIVDAPITDYTANALTFGNTSLDNNVAIFDGANSYFESEQLLRALIDSDTLVVSFKFRTPASAPASTQMLWCLSDSTVGNVYLGLLLDTSLNIQWRWKQGGAPAASTWRVDRALSANTNYHVVAVVSPSGNDLYIDGVASTYPADWVSGANTNTESPADFTNTLSKASVGAFNNSGSWQWFYGGSIKDLFIDTQLPDATTITAMASGVYRHNVIALAGQSNMRGNAAIRAGIDDDYASVAGKVFQFEYTAQVISAAENALEHIQTNSSMGCWLALCNKLASKIPYKSRIILVPIARGGAGFTTVDPATNWSKPNSLYTGAIASLNAVFDEHLYSQLILFAWWQGERDAQDATTTYYADLAQFFSDLTADVAEYGDDIPTALLEPGSWEEAAQDNVLKGLERFGRESANRRYISLNDLTRSDTLHYNAESVVVAGQRIYSAVENLLELGGGGGASQIGVFQ